MNKIKKIIISAIVALSIGNSAVSANTSSVYKQHLKRYILKENVLLHSEMDTNKDGNINVLDIIRYKQEVLYPEINNVTTTAPTVTTTPVTTTTLTTTAPQITTTFIITAPPAVVHKIYITKTGKRYHYDNTCNGGKYFESTLEEALAKGLTPCNKCVN